ncbi:hypothetical protein HNP81_000802 [Peribacillus huizhouensis]|uniref:Uncharacterized protein n=1 Tax=Peribacillus huizhouensis TaxID=1501239 RepID=A0ABR6CKD8_9BACI|nr:hypothetical protein [Peribacillus huizhouensis]
MVFRFIMIALFSLTASRLFLYQGTEIYHAIVEMFKTKA